MRQPSTSGNNEAELLLCRHTHRARIRQMDNGPLVVKSGSVGWPAFAEPLPYPHVIEAGSPHARYALAENDGSGWQATLCRVEYDWEAAARIAEKNNRPDLAYCLRTGLALRL